MVTAQRSRQACVTPEKNVHFKVEQFFDGMDEATASSSTSEVKTCPVCHSAIQQPSILHPCGHLFCSHCVFRWLDQCRHPVCPLCRETIQHVCDCTSDLRVYSLETGWLSSTVSAHSSSSNPLDACRAALSRALDLPLDFPDLDPVATHLAAVIADGASRDDVIGVVQDLGLTDGQAQAEQLTDELLHRCAKD